MKHTKIFFALLVLAGALFVFIHKKFHTFDVTLLNPNEFPWFPNS